MTILGKFAFAGLLAASLVPIGCQSRENSESGSTEHASPDEVLAAFKPTTDGPDAHNCPPEVIKRVNSVDLTSSDNSMLFSWIEENSNQECVVHCVAVVANRLDETCDLQVIGDFCVAAATYAKVLEPETKQRIKEAYLRFSYAQSIATQYFVGLRHNQIDIRAHLKGKINEDWSFTHPQRNAA